MVSKNLVRLAALVLALAATGVHASKIAYAANECILKGDMGMENGDYNKQKNTTISFSLEPVCAKQTTADFLNKSDKDDLALLLTAMAVPHNTLKLIPTDVIEKMEKNACEAFVAANGLSGTQKIVRYMTDDQVAKLPQSCFDDNVLSAMTSVQIPHITIPAESLSTDFVKLLLENANFLKNMTPEQFTKLVGEDFANCSQVDPAKFKDMNPEVVKIIDTRCLAANDTEWAKLKKEDEIQGMLRILNPSAFSKYPQKTSAEVAKKLTPSFISAIDSGAAENRCRDINVFTFNPAHAGAVSKECFQNAFDEKSIKAVTKAADFVAFFKNAPNDIFNGMQSYDTFKTLLSEAKGLKSPPISLFEELKVEQLRDLASHGDEFCTSLTLTPASSSFKYADGITADCFSKVPLDAKKVLLDKYALQLKENILASLTSSTDNVKDLVHHFESLAKARPALITNFGTQEDSENNPCRSLNVKLLKSELKNAGKHFHLNCIKAMEGYSSIELKDGLRGFPQVLIASLDLPALIEKEANTNFANLSAPEWKALSIPKVCALLKAENLNTSALKNMDAECFNEIKNVQALKKEQVENLPDSLLKDASAKAQLMRINKDYFTPSQKKILFPDAPAPATK